MNGQTDGWTDGQTDGWTNGQTERLPKTGDVFRVSGVKKTQRMRNKNGRNQVEDSRLKNQNSNFCYKEKLKNVREIEGRKVEKGSLSSRSPYDVLE